MGSESIWTPNRWVANFETCEYSIKQNWCDFWMLCSGNMFLDTKKIWIVRVTLLIHQPNFIHWLRLGRNIYVESWRACWLSIHQAWRHGCRNRTTQDADKLSSRMLCASCAVCCFSMSVWMLLLTSANLTVAACSLFAMFSRVLATWIKSTWEGCILPP